MPFLRDPFGRRISYLRFSVTDRCNLRCIYCMPPQGVPWVPRSQILTYQEIEKICRVLVSLGVEKIRVTGGEPLIRRNVAHLLKRLRSIPGLKELCITTNGVLLDEMAPLLKRAGIDRINVSLDSLDDEVYARITGFPHLPRVLKGIEKALEAGFSPLKVNMVVLKGINHGEVLDFVDLALEAPINVRFIEFMPFKGSGERDLFYPMERVMEVIASKYSMVPVGSRGPARDYLLEGGRGQVSFISPVTHPFCGSCNRLRITALGEVRPCLLSDGVVGLREALRGGATQEDLEALILKAVAMKPGGHGLTQGTRPERFMACIGG